MLETLKNNSNTNTKWEKAQPFDTKNVQNYNEWSALLKEIGVDGFLTYDSNLEYASVKKAEKIDASVTEKLDERLNESYADWEEEYKSALREFDEDDKNVLDAKEHLDDVKSLQSAFLAVLSTMASDQMKGISFESIAQLLAIKKLQESNELHDKGADIEWVEKQRMALNDVGRLWQECKKDVIKTEQ